MTAAPAPAGRTWHRSQRGLRLGILELARAPHRKHISGDSATPADKHWHHIPVGPPWCSHAASGSQLRGLSLSTTCFAVSLGSPSHRAWLRVKVTWPEAVGKPSASSTYFPIVQSALWAARIGAVQSMSGLTLREQKEEKSVLFLGTSRSKSLRGPRIGLLKQTYPKTAAVKC